MSRVALARMRPLTAQAMKRRIKRSASVGVVLRRQKAASIIFASVKHLLPGTRTGTRNFARQSFSFERIYRDLSDGFFKRLYRMTKAQFVKLSEELAAFETRSNASTINVKTRLSVTLRWLAGASYLDICIWHHMPIRSVYYCIKKTISELDEFLQTDFPYDDEEWLAESSLGFQRSGRSPLRGCVAALDGIAIRIIEPSVNDVENPSTYYNRKGFFALNVQILCDYKYRVLFVSCTTPGSSHDSTAYEMSALSKMLKRTVDTLPPGYWIAADDAYVCCNKLLTPWPGRNLPRDKDCFNYWLSSARITIEQTFGMIVGRWGVLWRPLRLKVGYAAKVVQVCAKLHNFIIDETPSETVYVPQPASQDVRRGVFASDLYCGVYLQDECDTNDELHRRRRDLEYSNVRTAFTERINAEGLRRPSIY